jgi:hypothetical protein
MKSFLTISAAALAISSPAFAQGGSDVQVPQFVPPPFNSAIQIQTSISSVALGTVGLSTMADVRTAFLNSGGLTSAITGGPIPPTQLQQVAAILSGAAGAGAAVTSVNAAIVALGAPPGVTSELTAAMTALSTATPETSRALIIDAAKKFNALIQSLPASSLVRNNLSPTLLALNAALTPITASVR